MHPDLLRLLRLVRQSPGNPGNWSGFPIRYRNFFKKAEELELAYYKSNRVTGGGGWELTEKGVRLVKQFDPLPRNNKV